VKFNIPNQVRDRLSDYMAEVQDEQIIMTTSGSRGIGPQGDEILHYPLGYLGFPNAFVAPDASHIMYADGSRANAAAMGTTAADKLGTNTIDKLVLRAKKQVGGQPDKSVRMTPISVEGGEYFVYLAGPESMYDLRREVGDAGWLTLEKAKTTAVGAKSPIFTGGKAFYNGVVIDETTTVVKFDTTVAGGSYGALAMRNLFLGANATFISYGSKNRRDDGGRYALLEDDDDYGEEGIIIVRMIAGFSKCRYNSMDFGVIANDVNYTLAS
jgi:N4-gp56 family major capsid protein